MRTPRMREVIAPADVIDVAKTILLGAPLAAWGLMLAIGAVHAKTGWPRPLGYWLVLAGCLALGALGAAADLRMRYMDRTGSRY